MPWAGTEIAELEGDRHRRWGSGEQQAAHRWESVRLTEFCLLPVTEGSCVPGAKPGAGRDHRGQGSEQDWEGNGSRIRSLLCFF